MRPLVLLTAFLAEAMPMIELWGLKPALSPRWLSRFQAFGDDELMVAVSGLGKLRASAAASAVLASASRPESVVIGNVGIAGCHPEAAQCGELKLINQVTDDSSHARFYPDILVSHPLSECALVTHDEPVSAPPEHRMLVDMEGSGFFQGAITFVAPSQIILLKVISDHCDGTPIRHDMATRLIRDQAETIDRTLKAWREELPACDLLSSDDETLLANASDSARFTRSQRNELARVYRHRILHDPSARGQVHAISDVQPHSKSESREIYERLMRQLGQGELP